MSPTVIITSRDGQQYRTAFVRSTVRRSAGRLWHGDRPPPDEHSYYDANNQLVACHSSKIKVQIIP